MRLPPGVIAAAAVLVTAIAPLPIGQRLAAHADPSTASDQKFKQSPYGAYGEVWHVPTKRREIALTFDDGPFPFYTPLLLHVLEADRVPATFFVVGRSAQEFPQLVERIVAAGDEIGNHTFNHYKLTKLNDAQIYYQIGADEEILEKFTSHPLTLFRPPHGRYDRRVVSIAREMGYHTIFWSDMPGDVEDSATSDLIAARTVAQATPGGIILLHSGQYKTIEALPAIIGRLRGQGYMFVTVGRLLTAH